MASEGLRVIGIGYRALHAMPETITPETVERDLTLLGLIGIVDPPREEAKQSPSRKSRQKRASAR